MDQMNHDFLRMPVWYPVLANHTFLTSFVRLSDDAVKAMLDLEISGPKKSVVASIIDELRLPMSNIPGNCFTCVDTCAPTDTERFAGKRGAVYSPESAWKYLVLSEKVRRSAAAGEVQFICLRPFRRMNRAREFRLFIHDGKLFAMSQYSLSRYFRQLDELKKKYWQMADDFVNHISWLLPVKTLVMDIYFTSDDQILVIDLNPWGGSTEPLLMRQWDQHDFNTPLGCLLMTPPTRITGDVNVSF